MTRPLLVAGALATALVFGCHGPRPRASTQTTLTSAEAPFAVPPTIPGGGPDIATLVAKVSPSVVNITATQEFRLPAGAVDPLELFLGRGATKDGARESVLRRRGLGSGFILDAEGHVVTNAHVVENATTVRVTLSDERELDAKVKGRDERLDLAVLELQGAKDLPRVALGKSETLRVGEYVVAIGNPFGLGNTVTMGIVSAKGRELGAGPYDDFIQTDASINPGNSGGPLFNLQGEVVGISTAINAAAQGISFAIPIDALKEIFPQLLEKGSVSRGRLGVAIQALDAPLTKALGLDKQVGALVGEVEPGSPAAKAGIKPGEVIVAIDGVPLVHAHELPRLIARRAPGTHVSLQVVGKGAVARVVDITLDELPSEPQEPRPPNLAIPAPPPRGDFGVELAEDQRGLVVVRGLTPGSTAADSLEPGDIILEVNGGRVTSARDAATRIRQTRADRPALLKVQRGSDRVGYVAIER